VAITRTTPREDTLERIELTADELTPPDLAKEEEIFGTASAHHSALVQLCKYLKTALWEHAAEEAPQAYASIARLAGC
jgi:hypothetical protein